VFDRDRATVTEQAVKDANRRLYDAVASEYEAIDGRRSPQLRRWLRKRLGELRQKAPGGRLLDVGSGSGLVTRCAEGLFDYRVGTDISPEILEANSDAFDLGLPAECDNMPFEDGSFDVVTCFAVLHHLFSFKGLVKEARRVLKPGGVFYTDHDMDAAFYRRFRPMLAVYRKLHDAGAKYRKASESITEEVYCLSECHETGIDTGELCGLLRDAEFAVEVRYHWFGLSPLTDVVFGTRSCSAGWAPLVSVTATKS